MDYRRNEDRLTSPRIIGARYNHIFLVEDTSEESAEIVEPVTVEEVKHYLRLEGLDPTDESPGEAFIFDDELIAELITEGRTWVETFTGLSLIPKTLKVWLLNQAGDIELPGPVTGTVVITKENSDLVAADTYQFMGTVFPKLITCFQDRLQLDYAAGYTRVTCPAGLKTAIKAYIAENYEHRGDEQPDRALTERAARKALPYRRLTLWA